MTATLKKANGYGQYVVFRLADEEFGIEISQVREVMKVPEITSMPGMAEFIEGIIYLRDRVVPVYDLRKRLDVAQKTDDNRIIIYEVNEERVAGLIVDAVEEILTLEEDQLESVGDTFDAKDVKYIDTVGILDNRLLLILKLDLLLSEKEKVSMREIAEKAKEELS